MKILKRLCYKKIHLNVRKQDPSQVVHKIKGVEGFLIEYNLIAFVLLLLDVGLHQHVLDDIFRPKVTSFPFSLKTESEK